MMGLSAPLTRQDLHLVALIPGRRQAALAGPVPHPHKSRDPAFTRSMVAQTSPAPLPSAIHSPSSVQLVLDLLPVDLYPGRAPIQDHAHTLAVALAERRDAEELRRQQ